MIIIVCVLLLCMIIPLLSGSVANRLEHLTYRIQKINLDILEENFPFCFTPHYDAQTFLANMQFAESMHTSTESLHNLPNLYISSTNRSTSSAVFA